MTPEQLKKYDIVITTYQTVTKEHGDLGTAKIGSTKRQKTDKGLFDLKWKVSSLSKTVCLAKVGKGLTHFAENYSR